MRKSVYGLTFHAMLSALCLSAEAQQQPTKVSRLGYLWTADPLATQPFQREFGRLCRSLVR
jgi:hypothetical protein